MSFRIFVTVAALAVALSGCNAARGLGQDIENLGLLMQGKKLAKERDAQREVVVSEVVSTQPPVEAEVVVPASANVEVTPLPDGGKVEVYPYPYPQEGVVQQSYPAPAPATK